MTYDIQITIDGEEFELTKKDAHKEGDAIPFHITKKDMEYYMNVLDDTIQQHCACWECDTPIGNLMRIKTDLQHRINKCIRKGIWK